MNKFLFLLVITLYALTGCKGKFKYNHEDFEFSKFDSLLFSEYKKTDTVIFMNKSGIKVGFIVTDIKEERNPGQNTDPNPIFPSHSKEVTIRHIRFHTETAIEIVDSQKENYSQFFLTINKQPIQKKTRYSIHFEDFHFSDTIFANKSLYRRADSSEIKNCYVLHNKFPPKKPKAGTIDKIIWTERDGMIGFVRDNGEEFFKGNW